MTLTSGAWLVALALFLSTPNRQSMEGVGVNDHAQTSIDMTFQCSSKAGSFGGGADYRFRLDLTLPQNPLYTPSQSDTGQSASLK